MVPQRQTIYSPADPFLGGSSGTANATQAKAASPDDAIADTADDTYSAAGSACSCASGELLGCLGSTNSKVTASLLLCSLVLKRLVRFGGHRLLHPVLHMLLLSMNRLMGTSPAAVSETKRDADAREAAEEAVEGAAEEAAEEAVKGAVKGSAEEAAAAASMLFLLCATSKAWLYGLRNETKAMRRVSLLLHCIQERLEAYGGELAAASKQVAAATRCLCRTCDDSRWGAAKDSAQEYPLQQAQHNPCATSTAKFLRHETAARCCGSSRTPAAAGTAAPLRKAAMEAKTLASLAYARSCLLRLLHASLEAAKKDGAATHESSGNREIPMKGSVRSSIRQDAALSREYAAFVSEQSYSTLNSSLSSMKCSLNNSSLSSIPTKNPKERPTTLVELCGSLLSGGDTTSVTEQHDVFISFDAAAASNASLEGCKCCCSRDAGDESSSSRLHLLHIAAARYSLCAALSVATASLQLLTQEAVASAAAAAAALLDRQLKGTLLQCCCCISSPVRNGCLPAASAATHAACCLLACIAEFVAVLLQKAVGDPHATLLLLRSSRLEGVHQHQEQEQKMQHRQHQKQQHPKQLDVLLLRARGMITVGRTVAMDVVFLHLKQHLATAAQLATVLGGRLLLPAAAGSATTALPSKSAAASLRFQRTFEGRPWMAAAAERSAGRARDGAAPMHALEDQAASLGSCEKKTHRFTSDTHFLTQSPSPPLALGTLASGISGVRTAHPKSECSEDVDTPSLFSASQRLPFYREASADFKRPPVAETPQTASAAANSAEGSSPALDMNSPANTGKRGGGSWHKQLSRSTLQQARRFDAEIEEKGEEEQQQQPLAGANAVEGNATATAAAARHTATDSTRTEAGSRNSGFKLTDAAFSLAKDADFPQKPLTAELPWVVPWRGLQQVAAAAAEAKISSVFPAITARLDRQQPQPPQQQERLDAQMHALLIALTVSLLVHDGRHEISEEQEASEDAVITAPARTYGCVWGVASVFECGAVALKELPAPLDEKVSFRQPFWVKKARDRQMLMLLPATSSLLSVKWVDGAQKDREAFSAFFLPFLSISPREFLYTVARAEWKGEEVAGAVLGGLFNEVSALDGFRLSLPVVCEVFDFGVELLPLPHQHLMHRQNTGKGETHPLVLMPLVALADFGEARLLLGQEELSRRPRGTEINKSPEMLQLLPPSLQRLPPSASQRKKPRRHLKRRVLVRQGEVESVVGDREARSVRKRTAPSRCRRAVSVESAGGEAVAVGGSCKAQTPSEEEGRAGDVSCGLNEACDVWCLGCLFFELLTGCLLFASDPQFFSRLSRSFSSPSLRRFPPHG
ncbi:pik3r4 kinase-related protein (incomplete catalytic triad) [Cyclospora cayetanensis]|uniref:Pik3r4 kinase-related protein (Incomplete catalytic triad) n=1 Tax=Cyclospora cayetanensis TaxID=88456 RepID=A0A1D3DAS1_9EIME|nr:pik3r4 kinase-related protein (incomplete catalytic triad) [Cyclospora cayetanensis]